MSSRRVWVLSFAAALLASCGPPPPGTESGAPPGTERPRVTIGPRRPSGAEEDRLLAASPVRADGLAAQSGWKVQAWGNRAEVSLAGARRDRALVVEAESGEKGKVALRLDRRLLAKREAPAVLAAYNTGREPVKVALGFGVSNRLVYYESTPQVARGGWNRLAFDLTAGTFKTQATGWKHEAALPKPLDVRQVYVLVYNGNAPTVVYLRGLHLETAPPLDAAAGSKARSMIAAEAKKLPASPRAKALGLEVKKGWWTADFTDPAWVMPVSAGENTLLLIRISGEKGAHKVAAGRDEAMRLAAKGEACLAVHASADVRVGLAFETSAGYFESKAEPVKAGAWREVKIGLAGKTFKSEKSKWKHDLAVEKRDEVKRVFVVVEGESGARVWLDGIELPKAPAAPPTPKAPAAPAASGGA